MDMFRLHDEEMRTLIDSRKGLIADIIIQAFDIKAETEIDENDEDARSVVKSVFYEENAVTVKLSDVVIIQPLKWIVSYINTCLETLVLDMVLECNNAEVSGDFSAYYIQSTENRIRRLKGKFRWVFEKIVVNGFIGLDIKDDTFRLRNTSFKYDLITQYENFEYTEGLFFITNIDLSKNLSVYLLKYFTEMSINRRLSECLATISISQMLGSLRTPHTDLRLHVVKITNIGNAIFDKFISELTTQPFWTNFNVNVPFLLHRIFTEEDVTNNTAGIFQSEQYNFSGMEYMRRCGDVLILFSRNHITILGAVTFQLKMVYRSHSITYLNKEDFSSEATNSADKNDEDVINEKNAYFKLKLEEQNGGVAICLEEFCILYPSGPSCVEMLCVLPNVDWIKKSAFKSWYKSCFIRFLPVLENMIADFANIVLRNLTIYDILTLAALGLFDKSS